MSEVNFELVKSVFLTAIRRVINPSCETPLNIDSLTVEEEKALFLLAKKHDLAHLVFYGLKELQFPLSETAKKNFKNAEMLAVMRYEQLRYEYEQILETFNAEKIPFVPLKGSILREHYAEPWLRTSCDIDILIHENDLDRAVKVLVERQNYQAESKNYHDISLYSQSNVHLELHFSILETMENIDCLLARVWDYTFLKEQGLYEYRQTNEYLAFHLIAHLLYHFLNGGCGVRTIIDLWLVHKKLPLDDTVLNGFLQECGIEKFYQVIMQTAKVWLEGDTPNEQILEVQEYVLSGGVYGSFKNKMKVAGTKVTSKKAYALQRIFQPYDKIKNRYPILNKHKWLLPFCEVARWVEVLFKGRATTLKTELQTMQSSTEEEKDEFKEFLAELGL